MLFHTKTMERFSLPVSARRTDVIVDAEKKLGLTFPVAVTEWYSELDGRHVLEKYSNCDHALPPTEFEMMHVGDMPLVRFMNENQWVCWWGFLADGSDDPPVFVNMDPPPDDLFEYSSTFSEFAYVRVFDHNHMWDESLFSMDICEPISEDDLSVLHSLYDPEPTSAVWPETTAYRFSAEKGRITIWAGEQQADWIMSANSPEDLSALRTQVAPLWRGHERLMP